MLNRNSENTPQADLPVLPLTMLEHLLPYLNDHTLFALGLSSKAHYGLVINRLEYLQRELRKTIANSKIIVFPDKFFLLAKDMLVLSRTGIQYAAEGQSDVLGRVKDLWRFERRTKRDIYYLLTDKNELWTCGSNECGQLGLGDTQNRAEFKRPKKLKNKEVMQAIFAKGSTYVLTKQGEMWVCGNNKCGQLGLGDTENRTQFKQPKELIGKKVVGVIADGGSVYAWTEQGELWSCGSNKYGQLGLGDTENRTLFEQPEEFIGKKIRHVIVDGESVYALTKQGELWSCGFNEYGQLGLGDMEDRTLFEQIKELMGKKIIYVIANSELICALAEQNELWIYHDQYNTLCLLKQPKELIDKEVISVIANGGTMYAMTKQGKLWVYGYGEAGQLGLGDKQNCYDQFKQPKELIGKEVISVIIDIGSVYALTKQGELWVCGNNEESQLGLGDNKNDRTLFEQPKELMGKNVIQIISVHPYRAAACALTDDGKLWVSGNGNSKVFATVEEQSPLVARLSKIDAYLTKFKEYVQFLEPILDSLNGKYNPQILINIFLKDLAAKNSELKDKFRKLEQEKIAENKKNHKLTMQINILTMHINILTEINNNLLSALEIPHRKPETNYSGQAVLPFSANNNSLLSSNTQEQRGIKRQAPDDDDQAPPSP